MSTVITPPITASAGVPAPPSEEGVPLYRLSVEKYHAMAKHGILGPEDRVELLHGLLVQKMTMNPPHSVALSLLGDALRPLLPPGWFFRTQDPFTTSDSEPEPDASLIRGAIRDYHSRHPAPGEVGLVAEVADSSLSEDRGRKRRLYAREAIPTYWIVNLVDNQVEVYTDPSGPVARPDYGRCALFGAADVVAVVLDGGEIGRITVRDLLP